MLQLGNVVLKNDQYYIKKMFTGIDELFFDASIWDEHYTDITEEASILETERGQTYLVKAIDGGASTSTIRCFLDLDDFYATIEVPYTNGSATLAATMAGSIPSGWTFSDYSSSTITRTIDLASATPMDVIDQCRSTYGVVFRFDNDTKKVSSYNPEAGAYAGAFMTRELNLKEINYKGVSTDLITALYCVGKDGMTFASINDGKAYVTNGNYKDKTIWGFWSDDRYTDQASFLSDATAKLNLLSIPSRSYQCDVVDLAKTNPDMYAFEDFDILKVVDLVDDSRGVTIRNKVVEYVDYPYYPARNVVTISTTTPNISLNVKQLNVALANPNSTFRQVAAAAQASATQQIIGGTGGYVVMNTNADKRIDEILIMNTADIATATKVWRWNSGGLGYSSTGYAGTYTTAITQDGAIVADFITTGTLNAAEINVINLIAENVLAQDESDNALAINSGELTIFSEDNFRALIRASAAGTDGFCMVLSGNTEYPGIGDPISSALLDASARLTLVKSDSIYVGMDEDAVQQGSVYTKNLYITAIAPTGNNLLTVDWRLVDLAGGGTVYALCQKA